MNFRISIPILLICLLNSTFGIKIDLSSQNTCPQENPECLNIEKQGFATAGSIYSHVIKDSHQTVKQKVQPQDISTTPSKAETLSQTVKASNLLIQNLEQIINEENVSPDVIILQNELKRLLKTLESSSPVKENKNLSISEKMIEEMALLKKQIAQQEKAQKSEELLYQTWALMNNNSQKERSTIGVITDTIFNITKLFVDGFFNNIEKIAFIFFFSMFFSFLCCFGFFGMLIYLFKRYQILSLCLNFVSDINNRINQIRSSMFDYYNQEREKLNQKQKKLREQGQMYLTALKEGYKRFDEIQSKKKPSQKSHLKKIREEPLKKYKEDDQDWIDFPRDRQKRLRKITSRSGALQKQKLKKIEFSDEEGSEISSHISQQQDFHQCPCGRKLPNDYSFERNMRQISKRAIFSELTETS